MSPIRRPFRVLVQLTNEELRAIDDWRFEKRALSRAAAVREIMRRGMSASDDQEESLNDGVELRLKKGKGR